jgi:hypothetical protein
MPSISNGYIALYADDSDSDDDVSWKFSLSLNFDLSIFLIIYLWPRLFPTDELAYRSRHILPVPSHQ